MLYFNILYYLFVSTLYVKRFFGLKMVYLSPIIGYELKNHLETTEATNNLH